VGAILDSNIGGGALRDWLRLFRAQTAPATVILILTPYLAGGGSAEGALALAALGLLAHWLSFGANSLHDWLGGWDRVDPSKAHHPLVAGRMRMEDAVRVIHWGLPLLMLWGTLLTLRVSPEPLWALVALYSWYVWGMAYNLGLSKVSVLGFVPISVCFTSMAAWGWLLSHGGVGGVGGTWLGYVFFTTLFQISWSGHLKDMAVRERGNLLVKLGARLEGGVFDPGPSRWYGRTVKLANILTGWMLLAYSPDLWRILWYVFWASVALRYLRRLTAARTYERGRELFNMSVEEVATIYLPLLMLEPAEAAAVAAFGLLYFFGMNRALWGASYPRV
jgi:hypothetical protein